MNIKITLGLITLIIVSLFIWQFRPLVLAPDIILTTLTGEKIKLKDLRGRPVLINFWATDCRSCIEEIPHLKRLYHQYHAQGLEIIGITMYYDLPSHVVAMTKAKQIPYPVSLDLRGDLAKAFGNIQLTPTTLLINTQGKMSVNHTGLFDYSTMEEHIQQVLSLKTQCY